MDFSRTDWKPVVFVVRREGSKPAHPRLGVGSSELKISARLIVDSSSKEVCTIIFLYIHENHQLRIRRCASSKERLRIGLQKP